MVSTSAIHDPLDIDVRRQFEDVVKAVPSHSPFFSHVTKFSTILDNNNGDEIMSTLSRLLAMPALSLLIAKAFRPLLLDLCARWIYDEENMDEKLVALCLLLDAHEHLFPVLNQLLQTPHFQNGPLSSLPADVDQTRLHVVLLAYFRMTQSSRELPHYHQWPLAPLSQLIWNTNLDNGSRLMAIRCYAFQSGMAEVEREKLEREVLGEPCAEDCPVFAMQQLDGSFTTLDGWMLPLLEAKRIQDARNEVTTEDHIVFSNGQSNISLTLCPLVCNVHGVLMLRSSGDLSPPSSLVPTTTAVQALQELSLHISMRLPTLVSAPPSSGKSLLITHLASLLHPTRNNQVITIQLADTSLDPRSLFGSYSSSLSEPGTFEWKEGVLVSAMRQGKWVVFEDIDKASNEVLGSLKPLFESLRLSKWIGGRASIEVPSRGRVVAAYDFAVIATRNTVPTNSGIFTKPAFFGAHKLYEVQMRAPTTEEITTIVSTQFPGLPSTVAHAAISLWDGVKQLGSTVSSRPVGLRELEKFCCRISHVIPPSQQTMDVSDPSSSSPSFTSVYPNIAIREAIYLEARDVFFGAGALTTAARAHTATIANTIADHLGLDAERREYIIHGRVPHFEVEKDANGRVVAVHAGRTKLPAKQTKAMIKEQPSRPFAMHRPAVALLSRIASAVALSEPLLLTGETGTGKTSVVTHLASLLRRPLISLNLSHQTESSDLLGGFKPVDARVPASELQMEWLELFGRTFSRKKNAKFEEEVRKATQELRWKRAVGLWKESIRLAKDRIGKRTNGDEPVEEPDRESANIAPRKRRRMDADSLQESLASWNAFESKVEAFDVHHGQGKGKFAFSFVEGPLVKAIRNGDWVLLDEINLASAETLECITGLLSSPTASITLTERGSLEPVPRHPDFRLFTCMNPATDVGKKDLPPNIRSRFTEIDVPPPDADKETLLSIITQYLGSSVQADPGSKGVIMNVAEFYISVKRLSETRQIADGSNHRPHYSMRTLARALTFAADIAAAYSLRRAIWEGCLMAFTMVLDKKSTDLVMAEAQKHLLTGVKNTRSLLAKDPAPPRDQAAYVKFGPFYLPRGPLPEDLADDYVLTPSVEEKLIHLSRIILTGRFPVLIEGPTSSGKTSSIEYLARRTGHQFVRINNHEHTDIQEYIGSYVSDPQTGKLVYKDGLLVRALRNGEWIVLDELNLAPTDVLEALNRLLDDNRELVIPETQEVIRPHPSFMLFATQNPPGLYAGRKILSRAFRNRFLEVHFEDVPQAELESILCQRCRIAPSYATRIVAVFQELQRRRQSDRVFESKHAFATLRDLFRWAGRDAVGVQELAENGYMLLAERTRRADDKVVVKEVIESVMRVTIDEKALYSLHGSAVDRTAYLQCPLPQTDQLVWTTAMQRLFVLIARALRFNEPVLLVGETGCGKTSVCQVYAEVVKKHLYMVNCHQNTETADLIGGLRPVRNRMENSALFEWRDGPLIEAMKDGSIFLMDEISLADDSVLERLNSVLESSRTIVLAEKGGEDVEESSVRAVGGFQLVATMNPGGDYGKKELSPALRNRFTEIWVPPVDNREDLELIISSSWKHEALKPFTHPLLEFSEWLCTKVADASISGLRDILAWVSFSNVMTGSSAITAQDVFQHAASMTFLDGLGSLPQLSTYSQPTLQRLREDAYVRLHELALSHPTNPISTDPPKDETGSSVQLGIFAVPKGPAEAKADAFNLQAPTTRDNAMRVFRACQVQKPILLEGSPGVGKTTLISALANLAGYHLCRINLSDQTDLMDLFGSDLPVEGGGPGELQWRDAEFLKALQEGHWVLLDEMNLAPQSVLEGLNAVLDHRGTVYIPELGKSFTRHPSFRIFAAQNPLNQGGGRKGLPKSFVNRFTKVYVSELSPLDLHLVCQHLFPTHDPETLRAMVTFNSRLSDEVCGKKSFGREGAPWEFNLRDIIRWGTLMSGPGPRNRPEAHLHTVYLHRFRNEADRARARKIFVEVFGCATPPSSPPYPTVTPAFFRIGEFASTRANHLSKTRPGCILHSQLQAMESTGLCVASSWLAIVTGAADSGKNEMIRTLADLSGSALHEISLSSASDTLDVLGSFEQVNNDERILSVIQDASEALRKFQRSAQGTKHTVPCPAMPQLGQGTTSAGLAAVAGQLIDSLPSTGELGATKTVLLERLTAIFTAPSGGFEWKNGPLVKALLQGHWLLIDGANLCNPSVLDRLNSLCEPNGHLNLDERGRVNGSILTIRPHPNFRLFMTVDPSYGELSRAMRNRGVEVFLDADVDSHDRLEQLVHHRFCTVMSPLSIYSSTQETLRRGICKSPPQASELRGISRLSNFSDLHNVSVPLAPIIQIEEDVNPDSVLFYAARAIPPASRLYIPRVLRTLAPNFKGDTAQRIEQIFSAVADGALEVGFKSTRQKQCSLWEVPLRFLLAQPLDFFLACAQCPDCSIHEESNSPHRDILRIINLRVQLFTNADGLSKVEDAAKRNLRRMPQAHQLLVHTLRQLMDSISTCGEETLVQEVGDSDSAGSILEVVRTLLLLSHSLQHAISTATIDFSMVHSTWGRMMEMTSESDPRLSAIESHLLKVNEMIALKSGHGLLRIWNATLSPYTSRSNIQSIQELDACVRRLPASSDADGLRRSTLQALSLDSLPIEREAQEKAVTDSILSRLRTLVESNSAPDEDVPVKLPLNIHGLALVLRALSSSTLQKVDTQLMEQYCEFAVQDSRSTLLTAASMQHVVWTAAASQDLSSASLSLLQHWFNELWDGVGHGDVPTGPEALLVPTVLHATIHLCQGPGGKRKPLSVIQKHRRALGAMSHLSLLNAEREQSRFEQLRTLWQQILIIVLSWFSSSFPVEVAEALQQMRFSSAKDRSTSFNVLPSLIRQSSDVHLVRAYEQHLDSPIAALTGTDGNTSPGSQALGQCWISLSGFLRYMYIPDVPMDPAALQNCVQDFHRSQAQQLNSEVALHRSLERIQTGSESSSLISSLDASQHHHNSLGGVATFRPLRPEVSQLHTFWNEITNFERHVIDESKAGSLTEALTAGDHLASQREAVLQESIGGFMQRLSSTYASYADIHKPLHLALHSLRLGLRLIQHSSAIHPHTSLVTTLLAFPSIQGAESVHQQPVEPLKDLGAPFAPLLKLSYIAVDVGGGASLEQHILSIESYYEQLVRLWHIDAAKEEELKQQNESLYKQSSLTHDATEESALEEEEFVRLFPSFENVLEDDSVETTEPGSAPKHIAHVTKDIARAVVRLHESLFGQQKNYTEDQFASLRTEAVHALVMDNLSSLPEVVDRQSFAHQLQLLSSSSRMMGMSSTTGDYNFYVDTNASEVQRAADVVTSLQARVASLVQEWPEQMVLQHLLERCNAFLKLDIASPLPKILSALEQLLTQTDDWEMYANRENTLAEFRQKMIALVVDWRRIELTCWKGLLSAEAVLFVHEDSTWWFRIYDALIRGPCELLANTHSLEGELGEYLESLVPLLEGYITSSSIGQFSSRLHLLESFTSYVQSLMVVRVKEEQNFWRTCTAIINNTVGRFAVYVPAVTAHLSTQREPLETEVKKLIKLASWKDVNVQALRQSSTRSHHQLYKIIRKFRFLLRQSCSPILQPRQATVAEEASHEDPHVMLPLAPSLVDHIPETESSVAHLQNLARTFRRFQSYIDGDIRAAMALDRVSAVQALSTEVISTAHDLAREVPKKGETPERTLQAKKALLTRKRKAWSDLLKELKQSGLSQNVKADVLRRQTNASWLTSQPTVAPFAISQLSGEKIDAYHHKLLWLMPDLRSLLSNHHQDIATRELQRGVMFLESGLSLTLESKISLVEAMVNYQQLDSLGRRLKMLRDDNPIVATGPEARSVVTSAYTFACRRGKALEELLRTILSFGQLHSERPERLDYVQEEVERAITEAVAWSKRLGDLITNVELSTLHFILQDEMATLRDFDKFLELGMQSLREWDESLPGLRAVFRDLQSWFSTQWRLPQMPPSSRGTVVSLDSCIDILLVSIQAILADAQDRGGDEEEAYIRGNHQRIMRFTRLLSLQSTAAKTLEATSAICGADPKATRTALDRLTPFLDAYMRLAEEQLAVHASWTKALYKLEYVLCSVMTSLARQGFCQPPDEDGEGSGDSAQTADGVGMGEGSGSDNVSKEIEDESQVEGLQGESKDEGERDKDNDDDDAIEMSEAFDGAMEDVPQNASDEEEGSDESDDEELDEDIGQLDADDPNAVDEKMWGDEAGPDESGSDEKAKGDHSKEENQPQDSELAAKEEDQQKGKQGKEENKASDDQQQKTEEDQQNDQEQSMPDEADEEEGTAEANGAAMDDFVADADTLDLPEDLDLDLDQEQQKNDMDDEEPEDGGEEVEGDQSMPEDREQKDDSAMDVDDDLHQGEDVDPSRDPNEEPEKDGEEPDDHVTAKADIGEGADTSSADKTQQRSQADTSSADQADAQQGGSGSAAAQPQESTSEQQSLEEQQTKESQESASAETGDGTGAEGTQRGPAPTRQSQLTQSNPLRNLGDALKEVQRQFEDILERDAQDQSTNTQSADVQAPSQLEYLLPDEEDQDLQALGSAEEQAAKLKDLRLTEPEGEGAGDGDAPMDIDDIAAADPMPPQNIAELRKMDPLTDGSRRDVEGAVTADLPDPLSSAIDPLDPLAPKALEERAEEDENAEQELRKWQADGYPEEESQQVWRLYSSLTHDLAYALCEQLRLILEPTLATRLKGDYRTGKRLNMKKIVPYIASDFTKDKIWLRRTRPSQREYQVLIALDDSKSMAESHSVHLAYQTLALVTRALNRLEAGDIAIAKFGKTVDILHGFDDGSFTDQSGTNVFSALKFNQQATDVLALINTTLKTMEQARERRSSSSSSELWQLQIIISDGICQDHDRLRTALRKAEEQRVLIVFIVIDSLHTHTTTAANGTTAAPNGTTAAPPPSRPAQPTDHSILSMTNAKIVDIDGKIELQTERYLDSFPFQYYVILRNVESLPEVLSSTLKQFFERLSVDL